MILGFETQFTMTVAEFDPPRGAGVTQAVRPGRGAIRATLEPTPERTRVNRSTDFELNPALRLMSPVFARLLTRQGRAASRNRKRLTEGTRPTAFGES